MGQFGANLRDRNVTDPNQAKWGDLDANEKGTRLFAGGMSGLGKGMQNYAGQQQAIQNPGGGGGFQIPMTQQPQVQLPGTNGQKNNPFNTNPFFYGGYGGGQ